MPAPTLPLLGGCLCGAVRFAVDRLPVDAGYCHCTRCQRRTGTAAAPSARLERGALRLLQGEGSLGHFAPPPPGFLKVFCRECGTALWAQSPEDPAIKSVRFGAFDDGPGIAPRYRAHVGTAAAWEPIPDDGLERFTGARPA
jgi:hypothetical protein